MRIVSLVPEALVDAAIGIYLVQLTQLLIVVLLVAGMICWLLARAQVRHRLAQEALAASEQRLQDIMTFSPALIYIKDHDGRYQFINRRFEQLLGIKQQRALGQSDQELFSPKTPRPCGATINRPSRARGPCASRSSCSWKTGCTAT